MSVRLSVITMALAPALVAAQVQDAGQSQSSHGTSPQPQHVADSTTQTSASAMPVQRLADVEVSASALASDNAAAGQTQLTQHQLNAKDLAERQVNQLADVVRMTPGVTLTDIGRFGHSGFNIRGMDGDRVKLTIDGVSVGETLDPAGFAPYDFFRVGLAGMDTDLLKNVSILKGPAALAAAGGALAGAVQLTSKDAADFLAVSGNDSHLRLKQQYSGGQQEWLSSVALANRQGNVESLVAFNKRHGHEMPSFDGRDPTGNLSGGARPYADPQRLTSQQLLTKLHWQWLPQHRLGFSYDSYMTNNQLDNLSRLDQLYLARWGIDAMQRDKVALSYDYQAGAAWFDELTLRVDTQHTDHQGITRMQVTNPCPQGKTPCLREEDRRFRQKLQQWHSVFSKEILTEHSHHQWVYGAQWQQKVVDFSAEDRRYVGISQQLATREIDPALVPATTQVTQSVYAQDELQWLDSAWSMVMGARWEHVRYNPELNASFIDPTATVRARNFAQASGQTQLHYQFATHSRLSLQLGRGMKAPTTEDLYLQTSTVLLQEATTGNTVTLPAAVANPALKPEQSENIELMYRLQLAQSQHSVALFSDRYRDLIANVDRIQNPQTAYRSCVRGSCTVRQGAILSRMENIASAKVHGLELNGHWQMLPQWQWHWAGSYQQGKQHDGAPLRSVMPWSAVVGAGYQPHPAWRLRLDQRWQAAKSANDSWQYAADGQRQPAAFLSQAALISDLSAQWQPFAYLQLNAGIFNVFDRSYSRWEKLQYVTPYEGAARGGVVGNGIRRYLEPGRHAKFSVTLSF
jgi:hemoglobin/transferrin/lactoferrin receptor protein